MLFKNLFLLRLALAIILLMHSIPGLFSHGIYDFGVYLNDTGFNPAGVVLAWLIKLSHIAAALALITNRFVLLFGYITIFILLMGIITVHISNGWFVVGGGSNGIEYNFLLIICLLTVMYPKGFKKGGQINYFNKYK